MRSVMAQWRVGVLANCPRSNSPHAVHAVERAEAPSLARGSHRVRRRHHLAHQRMVLPPPRPDGMHFLADARAVTQQA